MSIKRNGVPCYDKAGQDEPLFVLRAQDELAAEVVRYWADLAEDIKVDEEKIKEALECADQMEEWETHKVPD